MFEEAHLRFTISGEAKLNFASNVEFLKYSLQW